MDKEAWYSVTPEGIARHIARFISDKSTGRVIVDAFCGVSFLFSSPTNNFRSEAIPSNLLGILTKVLHRNFNLTQSLQLI